ncbi:Trafficking protein particle complex subunit [Aphelenchoides bicaudatus]|nr:Trafficking protein particle complex subunit [Aphelenchoides bicaudatus]
MTIYNLYLFNKLGKCVAYKEWNRERQSDMNKDEEFKLVYGMLLSLRSFSTQLSSKGDAQMLRGYRTSAYKMNYLETNTSLKFLLNTDPDAVGIEDLLHEIYTVYVDTVVKNPFLSAEDEVDSELFHRRLDDVVKAHHCYT